MGIRKPYACGWTLLQVPVSVHPRMKYAQDTDNGQGNHVVGGVLAACVGRSLTLSRVVKGLSGEDGL
ncbi:MAG: hypothetical protein L0H63_16010 [Nitrococcus sp.]|nr:hypothetical protein [Nitrococcus sp.]